MTETLAEVRGLAELEWRERVAAALDLIAERLGGPEHALTTKLAHQEELLKEFVTIMGNPQSTDQEWKDLLEDVQTALGMDVTA